MSLTASMVLFQGDFLDKIDQILKGYDYNTLILSEEGSINRYFDILGENNISRVVIGAVKFSNWTVFLISDLDMCISDEASIRFSSEFQTKIISIYCEGTTDSLCYYVYDQGELLRRFELTSGEITEEGEKQTFEIEYISDKFYADQFIEVLSRIGVDYKKIIESEKIIIKVFDTSGQYVQSTEKIPDKKKWWEFWK